MEGDIASLRRGLDKVCQGAEGKTDPWNNDGPALHATMAVDTLLQRRNLKDVFHRELAGFRYFPFDGNGPRCGLEILGIFRGIRFLRAEFVEIIVVADVVQRVLLFRGAEWALYKAGKLGRGECGLGRQGQVQEAFSGEGGSANNAHAAKKFATVTNRRYKD